MYKLLKRIIDISGATIGLIILSPFMILIGIFIKLDSKGGIFYLQKRVGKNMHDFDLFKFRTMSTDADKKGLLTVGMKDSRITKVGYFLRKYKLDELPQLLNVLLGTMSLVGPRPEVRKYVNMYNAEQQKVLSVQPGITDWASVKYADENRILESYENPEQAYIDIIMPDKLKLNLEYIASKSLVTDFKIIYFTILKIVH